MRTLRPLFLRPLYRVAWRLIQLRSMLLPGRGRGVKCVLTHGDRVLLVRHTYGSRRTWYVPGGAVRRHEDPLAAAAREMHEELGLRDLELRELTTSDMRLERVSVRLTALHAELPGLSVEPDPIEIAQAAWFAFDALPLPRGSEVGHLLWLYLEPRLRESGARESGVGGSDARAFGAEGSGASGSGASESGARRPGAGESGAGESGTRGAGVGESGGSGSGVGESGTREPRASGSDLP
jgi:8-oxo-dGTP pyrophosphatase MutT (NUDIX family)